MDEILSTVLIVAIWYLTQVIIYLCANLNTLWTIIEEGHAVAIMHNGIFHKMKMRYTGHHFTTTHYHEGDNLAAYDIKSELNGNSVKNFLLYLSSILFPVQGIAWVGIPPFYQLHRYEFKWLDDRFEPRKEEITWILLKTYVYGLILKEIELEGGIPYEIRLLITMRITNPAKALFRVHRWLDTSLERIYGWARDEFSSLSSDDFFAPTSGQQENAPRVHASEELKKALERIVDLSSSQLTPAFGVSIDALQINIDPSSKELRAVIIKKEVAKQDALAGIERALGKAKEIDIISEAASRMHPNALTLEGYGAIKGAGANVTLIGKDINLPAMFNIPTGTTKPVETKGDS